MLGELDGISHQVHEDLPDPARIADQGLRHVAGNAEQKLQALLQRAEGEHAGRIADDLAEIESDVLHLHFAGLDLREVEDVVDQSQQAVARLLDDVQIASLLGIQRRRGRQLGHAQDAVHRGADLLAIMARNRSCGLAVSADSLASRNCSWASRSSLAMRMSSRLDRPFRPSLQRPPCVADSQFQGLIELLQLAKAFGVFQGRAGDRRDEAGQPFLVGAEQVPHLAVSDVNAGDAAAEHENRRRGSTALRRKPGTRCWAGGRPRRTLRPCRPARRGWTRSAEAAVAGACHRHETLLPFVPGNPQDQAMITAQQPQGCVMDFPENRRRIECGSDSAARLQDGVEAIGQRERRRRAGGAMVRLGSIRGEDDFHQHGFGSGHLLVGAGYPSSCRNWPYAQGLGILVFRSLPFCGRQALFHRPARAVAVHARRE